MRGKMGLVTVTEPTLEAPTSTSCCHPTDGAAVVDHETAVELARRFKALADPARVQLLSITAAHDGHEVCVCDLTEPLGLAQPTVSHHLKILVEAGLLTREQRGRWAYYSLAPGALGALQGTLDRVVGPRAEEAVSPR
jgi:ArsR family transcriptional regulator